MKRQKRKIIIIILLFTLFYFMLDLAAWRIDQIENSDKAFKENGKNYSIEIFKK